MKKKKALLVELETQAKTSSQIVDLEGLVNSLHTLVQDTLAMAEKKVIEKDIGVAIQKIEQEKTNRDDTMLTPYFL